MPLPDKPNPAQSPFPPRGEEPTFQISLPSTPKMSDATFDLLRDFIYQRTGIYFQNNKKYLLEGRLGKRLHVLGMEDFESYHRLVISVHGQRELQPLFDAITINETFFFRNEPQFEALEKTIIPSLASQRLQNGKARLRIWSAASSSGEEAYTIAMIYLERLRPMYPWLEVEIVGTDINAGVLETARHGVYREYSIRNVPPFYLLKYFTVEGDRYRLKDEVRRLARFESLNLFDRPRMRSMPHFDIVLCCNVLIYFDQAAKVQVVSDLYDILNPGGSLLIGYAESLHGISSAFSLVNFPKTVAYKKD